MALVKFTAVKVILIASQPVYCVQVAVFIWMIECWGEQGWMSEVIKFSCLKFSTCVLQGGSKLYHMSYDGSISSWKYLIITNCFSLCAVNVGSFTTILSWLHCANKIIREFVDSSSLQDLIFRSPLCVWGGILYTSTLFVYIFSGTLAV